MSDRSIESDGVIVNPSEVADVAGSTVRTSASATLAQADAGKTFITITGGDDPVVFTLPASVRVGTRFTFIGDTRNCKVTIPSGVTLRLPWAAVTDDSIEGVADRGDLEATLCIIAETSTSWVVRYGVGTWQLSSDTTKKVTYSAYIDPPPAENNLVAFDAYGVMKDSGYARDAYVPKQFWQEVFIPVKDMLDAPLASPPAALQTVQSGSGRLQVRNFDPTTQEDLYYQWKVPRDIVVTSGLRYRACICCTSATAPASGEGVSFALQGYSSGNGDSINGTFGTSKWSEEADLYTAGFDTQYDVFDLPEQTGLVVTDLAIGELVQFHVYRDVSRGADDYAQDIGLYGIRIAFNRQPSIS